MSPKRRPKKHPKEETINLQVRMPASLHRKLQNYAYNNYRSLNSEVLVRLYYSGIDDEPKPDRLILHLEETIQYIKTH